MESGERIYRRTKAGSRTVRDGDPSISPELLRVLGAIESAGTHPAILRGLLPEYSQTVIRGWLGKLEALGLVESGPLTEDDDLDFTGNFQVAAIRAELERRKDETDKIDSLLLR